MTFELSNERKKRKKRKEEKKLNKKNNAHKNRKKGKELKQRIPDRGFTKYQQIRNKMKKKTTKMVKYK